MNALRFTEDQFAEFLRARGASSDWHGPTQGLNPDGPVIVPSRTQLALGRGVEGLSKPKRINSSALEWQECERLVRWADGEGGELYPVLKFLYAVPNGGYRHKAVAGKMKAQGVRSGVPDFCLDVARGNHHGLRIELKRSVGGTVSPAQKEWIAWLTTQGYYAIVCKGWQHARDSIVEYLSLTNGNANYNP